MKNFESHLRKIIFLDIETVSENQEYKGLDDTFKKLWDKKSDWYLREDPNLNSENLYREKAAMFAEFGKVVCVACGYFFSHPQTGLSFRTELFYHQDEKTILLSLVKFLNSKIKEGYSLLCAHNGKEFDFPFLGRRILIHQIALPTILQLSGKKPWEVGHLDTMELWRFGDRKNFTSLEMLAALFHIKGSKNLMDGSKVHQMYYDENNLLKIAAYCQEDVLCTAQVFLALHQKPQIPDTNIYLTEL